MAEKKIAYYQSVKFLRRWLKPNTVVYFDELMDQYKYWKENPQAFQKITGKPFKGVFYRSRKSIAENTNLQKGAQLAAEKILKDMGLITVTNETDHPNWYKIDFKKLKSLHQVYQEEQVRKNSEKAEIRLPDNYEALVADYHELDEALEENQTTSAPENEPALVQNADRNKNRVLIIDNKNKVSKATYVAEATDSIDEFYQELGLGSINGKESCIKEESEPKPPGARAHSETDFDEAIEIIDDYNRAMSLSFTPGEKETTNVLEKLNELRKVRKYFNSTILNKIWNQYGDSYTNTIENRRISAFIKCSLIKQLSTYGPLLSKSNDEEIDRLLDNVFKQYGDKISSIIKDEGYFLSYGSLEPIEASIHFPPIEHRKVRLRLYHHHIKKLLPEDEKHDMIKLEV
ncbi:MAG: hypothetical protein PQJ35_01940 [Sphaerochaetaceae bacterium]|nr:hypothetical protein [Sphaerochaetaceae bacterium]